MISLAGKGEKAQRKPAETPLKPAAVNPTFNPVWGRLALGIQPKSGVSAPDDPAEAEADRAAAAVMRMPEPVVQRTCAACSAGGATCPSCEEEARVQRKADGAKGAGEVASDFAGRLGGGIPLTADSRAFFEPRFGRDFSDVRIHADERGDASARSVDALAFTLGRHVVFRGGQYAPHSAPGRRLLAHELTHVVQQQGAGASLQRKEGNDGNQKQPGNKSVATKQTPTPATAAPLVPASVIPAGGESIDRVGIVSWDKQPQVRLRSSPDTKTDNIVTTLAFNTHVQVIKRFPGDWLFVSTQAGDLGYVAATYVWIDLPEPNANLHRVAPGLPGTAIAIAEFYYGAYAADWGQDLRFYVNVLAWANKVPVPDTTDGWRKVQFQADKLIWIPSHDFARSLQGVINSGSLSYNVADSLGVASLIERAAELWEDFRTAVSLSKKYLAAAVTKHVEQALIDVLQSLAVMLIAAVAILAISTAVGAAIGALAGGVGAAPGAAAGFEVGMVLLEWLGLAMLVAWIGKALLETAAAFGLFLGTVWDAHGDRRTLDQAAQQFAEAIGVLLGNLLEALALYAVSLGLSKGTGLLRASKIGKAMGETRAGEWLTERARKASAGETPIVGPRRALTNFFRGVEIVDGRNSPLGEFDGVDLSRGRFVENKSAAGLAGRASQTPTSWAQRQITSKTTTRIQNLARATATRATAGGSSSVPTLAEIQGIRHIHFAIDANTPALRAAVFAELANLKAAHPGWTFSAEFGINIYIPPVPYQDTKDSSEGN